MHTSQFPGQPNYYYPGQEYQAPTQGIKDLGLEGMQQQQQPTFMGQMPMNQAMPVDSKQQMWPNGNVPPPSFFQMFNSQLPPADASKMLMDYIQAQTGTAPNLGGPQSYGMNPGFPGQGQNNYGNNMGPYNPSGNQNDQGKRDFGGGYQNKFRNNNGGGFREREGDRGDRRDRGGRDERSDRGDRNRDERSGHGGRDDRRNDRNDRKDRNERPDRNDRGDRGERGGRDFSRNNQYDSGRGKRMDSPQRNKRSDRRSRSRSRSFERRDSNRKGGFGQQNNYNKEREGGGERFNNRGGNFNKPPFDRNQRGGDNSSQNQGNMSDWKCLGCGNVNWARRDFCNRCKVPRPENAPLVPKDESRSQSYQGKGGFEQKPNQHMNQYKRNDFKNEGYRENPSGHSNDGGI